jgi:hypothetical protein
VNPTKAVTMPAVIGGPKASRVARLLVVVGEAEGISSKIPDLLAAVANANSTG